MKHSWKIAIETSGRKGSAAIGVDGTPLACRDFATDTEHARDLLPVIQELFDQHAEAKPHIERCYLSIGPGSFTGLRVAVTFARHLAMARGTRLVAVPTLDVIATNALDLSNPPVNLAVILDAKRGQVFAAVFALCGSTEYRQTISPCLITPQELFSRPDCPPAVPGGVIGEGIAYHRPAVDSAGVAILGESLWHPRAANVYKIGAAMAANEQFTPLRDLVPFYIRRPEAEELWEKRHGSGGTQSPAGEVQ